MHVRTKSQRPELVPRLEKYAKKKMLKKEWKGNLRISLSVKHARKVLGALGQKVQN